MTPNPFLAQLDDMTDALVDLASRSHVISVVDSLPKEPEPRLQAVRDLTTAAFLDPDDSEMPGLRVAPRWFEHETPAPDDETSARYLIPREDGSGGRPFPYPTNGSGGRGGGKGGATICVSVGAVVCGSIGG